MENATDALIMAGSVLLLIIALTVSISSFSSLRTQVDEILFARDQIQSIKDDNGYINYLSSTDTATREVSGETIISALRRLRKEQYTVYVCLKSSVHFSGYSQKFQDRFKHVYIDIYTEDEKLKEEYNDIRSRYSGINYVLKFTIAGGNSKYVEDKEILGLAYKTFVKENSDPSDDMRFKEYIGIYQNKTAEGVSDANKKSFKIITFVEV